MPENHRFRSRVGRPQNERYVQLLRLTSCWRSVETDDHSAAVLSSRYFNFFLLLHDLFEINSQSLFDSLNFQDAPSLDTFNLEINPVSQSRWCVVRLPPKSEVLCNGVDQAGKLV